QMHDRGQNLVLRQAAQTHVLLHPPANFRQCLAEDEHAIVFVFVAHLLPTLMVTILLPAPGVAGRGLDVSVRRWTNPDIPVRGRNREPSEAHQAGSAVDRWAVVVELPEFVA